MTSELVLSLKSKKLAPLNPAPITSRAAMVDQTDIAQPRSRRPSIAMARGDRHVEVHDHPDRRLD
jgi:hypothetical protein